MHAILEHILNETLFGRIKWAESYSLAHDAAGNIKYYGVHERFDVEWCESSPRDGYDFTVKVPGKKSKTFSMGVCDDTRRVHTAIVQSRNVASDLVLLALMRGE